MEPCRRQLNNPTHLARLAVLAKSLDDLHACGIRRDSDADFEPGACNTGVATWRGHSDRYGAASSTQQSEPCQEKYRELEKCLYASGRLATAAASVLGTDAIQKMASKYEPPPSLPPSLPLFLF